MREINVESGKLFQLLSIEIHFSISHLCDTRLLRLSSNVKWITYFVFLSYLVNICNLLKSISLYIHQNGVVKIVLFIVMRELFVMKCVALRDNALHDFVDNDALKYI